MELIDLGNARTSNNEKEKKKIYTLRGFHKT